MAPLLAGFSWLPARAPVSLFCFSKKKARRFLFFVSIKKGEPAENPRCQKKRGAHRKKRASAVFCFELTTDERALCLFYGALSTYMATDEERALCLFYGAYCQPG